MDDLIHLRMSVNSRLPACWTKNGPLTVDHFASDENESTCGDCTARWQELRKLEESAYSAVFDQARINRILGEM